MTKKLDEEERVEHLMEVVDNDEKLVISNKAAAEENVILDTKEEGGEITDEEANKDEANKTEQNDDLTNQPSQAQSTDKSSLDTATKDATRSG